MAASKFTIEIELGNEEMRLPTHVAAALTDIAKKVPYVAPLKGVVTKIKDANGNTVGSWKYT